ncbi:MAG: 23S rRNA (guanosine(2251)-2'-O)-methyltransferase RlmB [Vicinamibacterales bacterium]
MVIYGINPVVEALKAGRVTELWIGDSHAARVLEAAAAARRAGVAVRRVHGSELDRLARGGVHQGVVATVEEPRNYGVADLVAGAGAVPLLVVLDGIEDPHNVGAILRTVDAAGGGGVIRQSRHAAKLGGAAAKAAAGALGHVRVADVVNVARAIEELKESGVWTVGLAGDSPKRYDDMDLTVPTAFVLGAEGSGLRRLVRERCDWLVSIPMRGHVGSLNVSVAAGIALFEAVRQRERAGVRVEAGPGGRSQESQKKPLVGR